jgi:peptidoglycan hydrolase-like protein with peptidoglycan-binding domain
MGLDASIKFDGAASMDREVPEEPDDELARNVLWLQQSLNKLGADPFLTEDGQNGPRTMAAVSQFQKESGLQDTGLADAVTIATIQRKLKPPEGGPVVPSEPERPKLSDPLQLLVLILTLLSKEKSMAGDFTKQGQDVDPVTMLLPLLLQSFLSGKQIDVTQLLGALLSGKSIATSVATPSTPSDTGVVPPDLIAILLPLICERLTGKPLPGTSPVTPTPAKPTTPPLTTVNGALGQTVGNMLNGRKTAVGVIGLLATTLLPIFFPGLAPIAAIIKPAIGAVAEAGTAGAAGAGEVAKQVIAQVPIHDLNWGQTIVEVAKPLFTALTGWGVLGKLDKWFNRVPQ